MKRAVGSVIVGTVPDEEAVPLIRAIISIKVFTESGPSRRVDDLLVLNQKNAVGDPDVET